MLSNKSTIVRFGNRETQNTTEPAAVASPAAFAASRCVAVPAAVVGVAADAVTATSMVAPVLALVSSRAPAAPIAARSAVAPADAVVAPRPKQPAPTAPRALVWGVRALAAVAPRLSDVVTERMFKTPRRGEVRIPDLARVDGGAGTRRPAPRTRTVEVDGEKLAVYEWGEGPAVLLAHGWEGDAAQMMHFVPSLLARGHRVVAFDQPAHGASTGKTTHAIGFGRAVHAVARAVGGVRAVIAHSLGATASALALAGVLDVDPLGLDEGLDLEALALIAPPAELPFFVHGFARALGLDEARTRGLVGRVADTVGGDLERFDLRRLATRQRARLLVLHDRTDEEVPFQHGAAIAAAWQGARLEELHGLGHRRMLRDPGTIGTAVDFVSR